MAIDFFGDQDRAKQRSAWMIALFVLAILLMIPTIYFLIWWVLAQAIPYSRHGYMAYMLGSDFAQTLWHPKIFGGVAIGVLAVVCTGAIVRMNELAAGGRAVANILQATPVPMNTQDPNLRKLVNVVEEMSIASGVAVPSVYVLENETGINACAAGNTMADSAIIVTRGALENLSREQLQGVIAHEYSHILNGDMNLNMQLLGLVFGLTCVAESGRFLIDVGFRRRVPISAFGGISAGNARLRGGGSETLMLGALGMVLYGVGWVGVLFGNILNAAVSRQRECLADAAAVQFTRNADGLAGALKQVALYGSTINTSGARQANHFFLCKSNRFSGLFETHPSLESRIKALDPTFDPESLNTPDAFARRHAAEYPSLQPQPFTSQATAAFGASAGSYDSAGTPAPAVPPDLSPQTIIAGTSTQRQTIGTAPGNQASPALTPATLSGSLSRTRGDRTDQVALDSAVVLKAGLPEPLLRASRELVGGCALVLAMLVSRNSLVQSKQLAALTSKCNKFVFDEMTQLHVLIQDVRPECKLPLISMTMPALRQLSKEQYAQLRQCMDILIKADDRLDLFEYAIQKIVERNLDTFFDKTPKMRPKVTNLISVRVEFSIVLSALAYLSFPSPSAAFAEGASKVMLPAGQLSLMSRPECGLTFVDDALDRLSGASKQIKDMLLEAAKATILADGKVTQEELEMVRALAESIGCALPLLICHAEQM